MYKYLPDQPTMKDAINAYKPEPNTVVRLTKESSKYVSTLAVARNGEWTRTTVDKIPETD